MAVAVGAALTLRRPKDRHGLRVPGQALRSSAQRHTEVLTRRPLPLEAPSRGERNPSTRPERAQGGGTGHDTR